MDANFLKSFKYSENMVNQKHSGNSAASAIQKTVEKKALRSILDFLDLL